MTPDSAHALRDRVRFTVFPITCAIALGAVLRVVLYAAFHAGSVDPVDLALSCAAGLAYDTVVSVLVLLPVTLAVATLRMRVLGFAPIRFLLLGAFGGALTFQSFVEYFYFDEYDARFNYIALDYLLHPKEVFGNIWESYDVPLYVGMSVAAGIVVGGVALRVTRGARFGPYPWSARWRAASSAVAVAIVAAAALEVAPSEISRDRIVSEIAQNGIDRLVHAFRTGGLDYDLYYRTLPRDVARRRAAEVLGFPPVSEAAASREDFRMPAKTRSAATGSDRPWDVVVLEESLGSEFIGVLGHADRRTSPGFDRWSREGIFLTNLTATGNRTVRGLEGTLCSFVPLPGDAILKSMSHEHVLTLADIFLAEGYRTAFFYGGWGRFDDMKPFFPNNGFEEFHERDDFPDDAFSTVWGVADEYIFDDLLERQRAARSHGERLFATVLSVSNHKPFDVPERGTAWPASARNRNAAVAYADWALANYLDRAKAEGFLDHTLVLVEGDQGPASTAPRGFPRRATASRA